MKKDHNLTIVPTSVPIFPKDFMAKKHYSDPVLYIPKINGKPTVAPGNRWYVYFYLRDDSGKLTIKQMYTRGINRLKTVKERKEVGKAMVQAYRDALERGWDPITKTVARKKPTKITTLSDALEYAYKIKEKYKKTPTLEGYRFHLTRFNDWAFKNGLSGLEAKRFTIDHFYEFLDWLRFEYVNEKTQEPLSGSSINNHKASLSALFTTMKNERLINDNFIKGIPKVDEEVVNNKAFTPDELKLIKAECEKKDPYLIPFISFILYPLLRPVEICRLKVRDINTEDWLLSVETKTATLSHRRIIEKIKPVVEAMDLKGVPGHYHLFSNDDKPKDWSNRKEKGRADTFGIRFRPIKNSLGFGREYSLYSCRHTAIMDLYNSMVDDGLGEMEIIMKIMPITQHRSIEGVKKYLRRHRQTVAPDHSASYSIDF